MNYDNVEAKVYDLVQDALTTARASYRSAMESVLRAAFAPERLDLIIERGRGTVVEVDPSTVQADPTVSISDQLSGIPKAVWRLLSPAGPSLEIQTEGKRSERVKSGSISLSWDAIQRVPELLCESGFEQLSYDLEQLIQARNLTILREVEEIIGRIPIAASAAFARGSNRVVVLTLQAGFNHFPASELKAEPNGRIQGFNRNLVGTVPRLVLNAVRETTCVELSANEEDVDIVIYL